jgi:hypothetical protein
MPDGRQRPNPTLIASTTGAGASTGFSLVRTSYPAGSGVDIILFENQEIPLLPGEFLQLISGALNQSIATSWFWRERILEESERT